jgi:RNA-splicing ligase RtcB
MSFTGKDLIEMGFEPGPWFKDAIQAGSDMRARGASDEEIARVLAKYRPPEKIAMRDKETIGTYRTFLPRPVNETELRNEEAVHKAMDEIMRVPTVEAAVVMPDACPAGTIPVGGVVATRDTIHPGYHSADVCCSMAVSVFGGGVDPKRALDIIEVLTHFGPTKRSARPVEVDPDLIDSMEDNVFLSGLETVAVEHFSTQGDGNHFYYVGHLENSGHLAVVSHHGSRGLGARLYKRGMQAAQRETAKIARGVPKGHAWLNINTDLGDQYWEALRIVREWTRQNHFAVHDALRSLLGVTLLDRFWNPHNFVFRRNGLFMHAKGATPSYTGHSRDDDGRTLIPMNMAEPILVTRHAENDAALGFAPHGAGRNMSRTQFLRENIPETPEHIDTRFACGIPDPSELPAAYKSAHTITNAIKQHDLAIIEDRILPYGSIMAGDWERDAPWKKRRQE